MAENFFNTSSSSNTIKKVELPLHTNIVKKLDDFLTANKVPNLLFHGISGSGKRTIVNNFINKIYNDNKYQIKRNVLNVNCSHGKGIKFIREDLKFFAKTNLQSESGVNFKTIVLLNADSLTTDAQSALRRCIEQFSYNTRFFIVVENKHKLLVPILSRFCEIYVPELIENAKIVNLHDKFVNNNYNLQKFNNSNEYVSLQMSNLDIESVTHKELIEFTNKIYEKGFSCIDIINWIKLQSQYDELLKSSVILYYEKIKSEYRSEPLLIFTILGLLMFKNDKLYLSFD
tara:strand:- start:1397 stop:2257 length:861 start_codon:yes stop_codon:yes gene_type:complete